MEYLYGIFLRNISAEYFWRIFVMKISQNGYYRVWSTFYTCSKINKNPQPQSSKTKYLSLMQNVCKMLLLTSSMNCWSKITTFKGPHLLRAAYVVSGKEMFSVVSVCQSVR